ncbi:MAG TPA: hypothetical protein PLO23_03210 [Alphaproteobacteria bacterium]|nr:hypothetical protein [Alphaproteobacteria bacterium]
MKADERADAAPKDVVKAASAEIGGVPVVPAPDATGGPAQKPAALAAGGAP